MAETRSVPLRIAVVDSGIDGNHPGVRGGPPITAAVRIDAEGRAQKEPVGRDELGHGTAVAATIRALAPTALLVAVRVFAQEPRCTAAVLTAALRHCADLDVQLVNVSLGLAYGFDPELEPQRRELAEAVAALLRAGRRILAPAADAAGRPSLPGQFAGVEAVVADPNVPRSLPQRRTTGPRPFWFASPFPPEGIAGLPAARVHGSSLAVANVCGFLANGG